MTMRPITAEGSFREAQHLHRFASRTASFPYRVLLALARYIRTRRDYAALGEMPDYLLADIGLTRLEISRVQKRHRGQAWRIARDLVMPPARS
ncbi:DUF1127 domain-containing protein [Pseudorhizobium marinum]|uniref:DUF1127 domain-containing protein n=1 Tax=Pseudorhizobium marinum TaxID=1496690 RepID=UPI0004964132|nr:DUF1127 domain-containing protein [Pseudorhizobium marinum]